jgi:glucosylceramidase
MRNGTLIATTSSTSYVASGLSASTAYSFTVNAFDAAGNTSAASSPVSVTTSAAAGGGGGGGAIDSSRWYTVTNVNSHKCVDAANGGTANGTAVQQWTCFAGNANQQWQFQPTDSGFYKVVTRNAPALGWDVTGGPGATGNGVKIQLWTYGGGTNEQWKPVVHADGSYAFNPRNNTSECLDVTDVSTADGARLQQWACTGSANQSFTLSAQ